MTTARAQDVELALVQRFRNARFLEIAVDKLGNTYHTGFFSGTVDFGFFSNAGSVLTSIGEEDVFVMKLSPSGSLVWVGSLGSEGSPYDGSSIAVDEAGDVYLTGRYDDHIDLDPGPAVYEVQSDAQSSIFVTKLSTDGELVWGISLGNEGLNQGSGIATDKAGNVIVTGYFSGSVDFDPGNGVHYLDAEKPPSLPDNSYYVNTFLMALDGLGNLLWAKSLVGSGSNTGYDTCVTPNGDVLVVGAFEGSMDLDPGESIVEVDAEGQRDAYVLQFSPAGNFVWGRTFGGAGFDGAQHVQSDALGNVLTSGSFTGSVDLDPGIGQQVFTSKGRSDYFLQKLDRSGNLVWAVSLGGAGVLVDGFVYDETVSALATDDNGGVYTTGYLVGTADIDPGPDEVVIGNQSGNNHFFLQKLNSEGRFEWVKTLGQVGESLGSGIAIGSQNEIYSSGWYLSTVDGDPGPAFVPWTSEPNGADSFLWKFNPADRPPSILPQLLLDVVLAIEYGEETGAELDSYTASALQPSLTHVEFNNWDANNDGFLTARELTARVEDTYGCFAAREEAAGGLSDAFVLGVAILALACSHVGFNRPNAYMD